jgi:hypothetical protein
MLKEKYGEFVSEAKNVKNQKLSNLTGSTIDPSNPHVYVIEYRREFGIQTSRVTGIFHSIWRDAPGIDLPPEGRRIDVTLIPTWENK